MKQIDYILHTNEDLEVTCPYCDNSFNISANESIVVSKNTTSSTHVSKVGCIASAILLTVILALLVVDCFIQSKKKKRPEMHWKLL